MRLNVTSEMLARMAITTTTISSSTIVKAFDVLCICLEYPSNVVSARDRSFYPEIFRLSAIHSLFQPAESRGVLYWYKDESCYCRIWCRRRSELRVLYVAWRYGDDR